MAGFVQIMEFDTSKIDEVDALGRELAATLGSSFKARKATTTEDRERRGHYYIIVEFDSYEEAMQNSENPQTAQYSERWEACSTAHRSSATSTSSRCSSSAEAPGQSARCTPSQ